VMFASYKATQRLLLLFLTLAAVGGFVATSNSVLVSSEANVTGAKVSRTVSADSKSRLTPLRQILRPDGTLDLQSGFSGRLDSSGWRMTNDATGQPRFVKDDSGREINLSLPDDVYWDTQLGGTGAAGPVYDMAVSGTDLYIGGEFPKVN